MTNYLHSTHTPRLLIFLTLSLSLVNASARSFTGYVTEQLSTPLYERPNREVRIGYLIAGQELTILKVNKESWNKIRLKDGIEGWIESEYIRATPGRKQQIFEFKKKQLSLQKELANHKKATNFLQDEIQKYRAQNVNLKKQNFNQQLKLEHYEKVAAAPIKISQKNLHLKKNIEFLKFDNSVLNRTIQNIDEQNRADWQTLIIIFSIIFLLLGYLIGHRIAHRKRASWNNI